MAGAESKQLEWSRLGLRELFQSFEYVASQNLSAAIDLREKIAKAAELLVAHPLIGRPGQRPGTREYAIPGASYTLVYRVYSKKILIGRVLHQRRRYP